MTIRSSKTSSVKVNARRLFKVVLVLGAAALLAVFAFKGVSIRGVLAQIFKAKPGWVLLSVLASFIALFSRGYRWKLLIEPLGYHPKLMNATYSVMVGYLANLAFPRLGEVTRCGSLSTAEDIPFNKLLGTVVVERIIDVLSLLVCVILVAIIESNRLGSFLKKNLAEPLFAKMHALTSSTAGIIILLGTVVALATFIILFARYSKKKSKSKWTGLINGFVKGLVSIKDLRKPWQFVFHSIFIWLLYYLSVYICLFALPFTSHLGSSAALFLLVAGGLGMSAPVQGGIGAYHLLVSQGLLLYGISLEDGLAFATLLHSIQLLLVIVTGLAAMLMLFVNKRSKKAQISGETAIHLEDIANSP